MTFSDIDERQEENAQESDDQSEISWKSDEYAAMIGKTSGGSGSKKNRVVFEDEIPSSGKRDVGRPKSACSVHQDREGKVSRLYSLTKGQCRAITRCNSALGLRRHDGKLSRSPCQMQDLSDEAEKKYNIVNFKRSLKLLGFDPEEFGIETECTTQKPRTKNVKPMTITRLERRTVSLDDVKKAVLNEFENDLRFPDHSHRQMLAKAVYEEWYFKKRDEAIKKREQAVKQSKVRQWEREHNKNEAKKKCQETYEEWLNKKKVQQKMEKLKASSMMNSLNKRSHQEKSELAFHTWKKEKEIALQKKLEDKKKEKQNQEEEEKERKRIEAEKAYDLWKRKTEEEMRKKKLQREKQLKEKKTREVLQVEERHRNADASFRYWRQRKEQELREQMKRSRRAKELAMETRARMRDNQMYESNHAFMEWLDMIEERLHLQNLLDEKHKCSKHPPWFPTGSRSYL